MYIYSYISCVCIYAYIYIERESERYTHICVYMCIPIYAYRCVYVSLV